MTLTVIEPGLRALIQDNGRRHHQHHGLAVGGAADRHAFHWANKLLDNPAGAACLEILLGGFEARAEQDLWLAVTGAPCECRINGEPVEPWASHLLRTGERIVLGRPASGLLSYLAVRGGWRTHQLFGSRSVVPREQFADLRPLARGDRLPVSTDVTGPTTPPRRVPERFRPDYDSPLVLRLVPGYQFDRFDTDDHQRIFRQPYRIDARSDRMGYRLQGPALTSGPDGVISEGIALGSVQVPGDGQPIILLDDRQTIGGYAKLGTVAAADCSRLVQRPPGTDVRFAPAELADIQAERMLASRFFECTRWLADGRGLVWTE